MGFPQFPSGIGDKISFSGEVVADLLFFLCTLVAALASIIMFFHWRKYGMGGPVLAITEVVYISVSAVLLATAFFSLN